MKVTIKHVNEISVLTEKLYRLYIGNREQFDLIMPKRYMLEFIIKKNDDLAVLRVLHKLASDIVLKKNNFNIEYNGIFGCLKITKYKTKRSFKKEFEMLLNVLDKNGKWGI